MVRTIVYWCKCVRIEENNLPQTMSTNIWYTSNDT